MEVAVIIIFSILGLAVGSFLNVCIDRLPAGKSIITPPSYCDACGKRISTIDLVPVFSYIFLGGNCRYCQAKIPKRVLFVELFTGILFALLMWHYGLSAKFGVVAFYFCVFIVLGVIDLKHQLILNKIVYPAAVIALIIDFFLSDFGIIQGLIGFGIGFGFFLVVFILVSLLYGEGMGFGDVKLAGLIGLAVGSPNVVVALLLGIILGGVVAIVLLALKVKKRKEAIPFGPFLALGAMVTLVWGDSILWWWLGLFSF